MKLYFAQWLEEKICRPSYSGGLLFVLSICFFGAATNTMSGWLYVLSSLILVLLAIGSIYPPTLLGRLTLKRKDINPVNAGEDLQIEIIVENSSSVSADLFQIVDFLPHGLAKLEEHLAIETIGAQEKIFWRYSVGTSARGLYNWQKVKLRTASPLGLFWRSRTFNFKLKALVYPQILNLTKCPILDASGEDIDGRFYDGVRYKVYSEGIIRNLRSYRPGDSTRLIHWRSSAKFEEFRVKELEIARQEKEDMVIALDTNFHWQLESFEKAIIATASLYCYAVSRRLNVKLWLPDRGILQGKRLILETLATLEKKIAISTHDLPPDIPLIWLTADTNSLNTLSLNSKYILFDSSAISGTSKRIRGIIVDDSQSLEKILQSSCI